MSFVQHLNKVRVKRVTAQLHDGDDRAVNTTETFDSPDYDKQDLSHFYKTTGKLGCMYPCMSLQVNAGDRINAHCNMTQQFQPILAPTLSSIQTHVHTFFLPMSVLDYGWHMFNTTGVEGTYDRPLLNIDFDTSISTSFLLQYAPKTLDQAKINLVDGFSMWGVKSLLFMLDYPMQRDYMDAGRHVIGTRPIGPINPARLIAYSRIYNEKYRVPLIETDEWTDQQSLNLIDLQSSLDTVFASSESTPLSLSLCLSRIRSIMPNGWMDFTLHYLTDPHFESLRKSTMYGTQFYDPSLNRIKFGNFTSCFDVNIPAGGNAQDSKWYVNTSGQGLGTSDLLIFAFCLNLFFGRCAPWERSRANLMLPWLQKGQYERLSLPLLSDKTFTQAKTIDARHALTDLVGSFDNPSNKEVVGYTCELGAANNFLHCNLDYNSLREMSAVTRFLEKSARIGYKWDEWLKAFFGISDKNYDPHDPVYMGGLKADANVDKITSTADTEAADLGDFAGQAFSCSSSDSISVSAPETGIVLALYYTKPRMEFMHGFDRNNVKWKDKFLFYFPEFAHLQEQPVFAGEFGSSMSTALISALNGDVGAIGQNGVNMLGYEPRLSEYKQHNSHIGGELVGDLKYWTMSRDLQDGTESDVTALNNYNYQHVNPFDNCVNRIFQIDNLLSDNFIARFVWNVDCITEVPLNTEPTNNI